MDDKCTTLANNTENVKRGKQTYYLGEVVLNTDDYAVENIVRDSLLNSGFDIEVTREQLGNDNFRTKLRVTRTV